MRNYSPRNTLSVTDLQKILNGAKMALTGVMGAILLDYITQAITSQQLSTYGGIAIAGVLSVVANLLRKFRTDNTEK